MAEDEKDKKPKKDKDVVTVAKAQAILAKGKVTKHNPRTSLTPRKELEMQTSKSSKASDNWCRQVWHRIQRPILTSVAPDTFPNASDLNKITEYYQNHPNLFSARDPAYERFSCSSGGPPDPTHWTTSLQRDEGNKLLTAVESLYRAAHKLDPETQSTRFLPSISNLPTYAVPTICDSVVRLVIDHMKSARNNDRLKVEINTLMISASPAHALRNILIRTQDATNTLRPPKLASPESTTTSTAITTMDDHHQLCTHAIRDLTALTSLVGESKVDNSNNSNQPAKSEPSPKQKTSGPVGKTEAGESSLSERPPKSESPAKSGTSVLKPVKVTVAPQTQKKQSTAPQTGRLTCLGKTVPGTVTALAIGATGYFVWRNFLEGYDFSSAIMGTHAMAAVEETVNGTQNQTPSEDLLSLVQKSTAYLESAWGGREDVLQEMTLGSNDI